jgi:hypothetical protein
MDPRSSDLAFQSTTRGATAKTEKKPDTSGDSGTLVIQGDRLPEVRVVMAVGEVCGNDYQMSFEVRVVSGDIHVFDSF